MSIILVDMDGVIADWGAAYGRHLDMRGPAASNIPRHADQRQFNLHVGRTPEEVSIIDSIMVEPGFYAELTAIPGARTALRQMKSAGHDVRIVTSPWVSNPTCASDKLTWIDRKYGGDWASRVVITSDKTVVRGDILIDDKPEVTGSYTPAWEHVLYDQPYNRSITDKRRLTHWAAWEELLA